MNLINAKKFKNQLKGIPVKNMAIASLGLVGVGYALKRGLVAAGVLDKVRSLNIGGAHLGDVGIAAVNGALTASALSMAGAGAGASSMALILGPGSAVLREVSALMAGVFEGEYYGAAESFGGSEVFSEYEQQLEDIGFQSEVPALQMMGQ
tara:strand:+ start:14711 stop:15163 length:453 start_codon:yes stop_codon:yes gene_type:complete